MMAQLEINCANRIENRLFNFFSRTAVRFIKLHDDEPDFGFAAGRMYGELRRRPTANLPHGDTRDADVTLEAERDQR